MKLIHISNRIIFASVLMGYSVLQAWGLGVSPSLIEVHDILKGTTVQKIIQISRGNLNETDAVRIELSGETQDAVTLDSTNWAFSPDSNAMQIPLTLHTKNLSTGTHSANLTIHYDDSKIEAVNQSFPGVSATIEFSVTDEEKHDLKILSISGEDSREGQALQVQTSVENRGNVSDQIQWLQVEWMQVQNPEIHGSAFYDMSATDKIPPFASQDQNLNLNGQWTNGLYQITAKAWSSNEVLLSEHKLHVQVLPATNSETNASVNSLEKKRIVLNPISNPLTGKSFPSLMESEPKVWEQKTRPWLKYFLFTWSALAVLLILKSKRHD